MVAKTLAPDGPEPRLRVWLAGGIALRAADGTTVDESEFAGRQGRLLFVRLAAIHEPARQADLADLLWDVDWPGAWQVALRAHASKIRSRLESVGAADTLISRDGTYALVFQPETWIDLDAAGEAMHRAEVALACGEPATNA